MTGRFIAIEGGDGAGKTLAISGLSAALAAGGRDVLTTREPGGTPEGLALRALLLAEGADWEPHAELLLMTAARAQHAARVIRPALTLGRTVLCDRFIGSTLAYQGGGRGLDPALILDLHRRMVGDPWPDLTVLLDVDPATGVARSRARLGVAGGGEGRFEALDAAFHARVRASFLEQARADPARTRVIDAGREPKAVLHDLVARVTEFLGEPSQS